MHKLTGIFMNLTFLNKLTGCGRERMRQVRRNAKCARIRRKRKRIAKRTVPAYENCKNCGANLHGMYCHKCGQYALEINPSFWKYVNEFFQNTYQYDGRLVSTFRLLFTKPGKLTVEFDNGRINCYVHPLKLYMFVSIVFFSFIMAFVVEPFDQLKKEVAKEEPVIIDSNKPDSLISKADSVDLTQIGIDAEKITTDKTGVDKEKEKRDQREKINNVIDAVESYTPMVMVCLIPLYAGLLRWHYRRTRKRYLSCFVFAIHIQTIMLLGASVLILFEKYTDLSYVPTVILSVIFAYLVVASIRFFGVAWWKAILKSVVSILGYIFLSSIIVIAALVLGIIYFVK